jgi:hypothetical protein
MQQQIKSLEQQNDDLLLVVNATDDDGRFQL